MNWLVEEGIGEHRAIRVEGGISTAARLHWPGALCAGQIADAQLVARNAGSNRGTARFANGEEALVDRLARSASEGSTLRLEITRPAMAETGRMKRAHARISTAPPCPAPSLAEMLERSGYDVKTVHRFPVSGWEEIASEAFTRAVDFDGGSLHLSPTPAMTLIDVDGDLPVRQLALAAIPAIASAVQRLDIGGSIGIDFPTLSEKTDRRAVDQALADALSGWPHERTAMNGFGFVHLVARLERVSILHRLNRSRVGAATRLLMRQAEDISDPGAIMLTAHPALTAHAKDEWLAELARRTGREIRWQTDPALALEAGFAQAVPL